MTTPKRGQIIEKAIALWKTDQYQNGCSELADTNPEIEELAESGYLQTARSTLMQDQYRHEIENRDYVAEIDGFEFNLNEALKSGVYICGTTGTGKSDVAMHIAEELMKHDIIVIVFDPSQDWINRSSIPRFQTLINSFITEIPQTSLVYDISRLSIRKRQKLIETFSQQIYQYQAETPKQDRKQYFLIFEEAENYFPQGCMRARRFENTSMLMSEGRNYKVRFCCITQFSAMIDKQAMRYMKQRYFGYTDEFNDVQYLKAFLGNECQELKKLDAGTFLYYHAGTVKKIDIEPFNVNIRKTEIKPNISQLNPIETIKPKQTNDAQAITSLFGCLMWLIITLVILSQI